MTFEDFTQKRFWFTAFQKGITCDGAPVKGFKFVCEDNFRPYEICYWVINGKPHIDVDFLEDIEGFTKDEVVKWVEKTFTLNGFDQLYADIYSNKFLKNF